MDRNTSSSARTRPALIALALGGLLLAALLLTTVGLGAWGGPPRFHGTAWEPAELAADFQLTEHTGRSVRLSDYHGRAVLLFFGYASCPDVCPLTLNRLSRVLESMEADTSQVKVLLVTVDPERDTPEALAQYVERFSPHVSGLTGDPETLAEVRKRFYVYAEPAPADPSYGGEHAAHGAPAGEMNHTPQVFGIDRTGQIRVLLPMERPEEEIAEDIRTLMRI